MKQFTLGLIFNATLDRIVLMRKNRPDWQQGRLNGVGGKIEKGETSIACIVREVEEETTLSTNESDWLLVANLGGDNWSMDVYCLCFDGEEQDIKTCTDEKVEWLDVSQMPKNIMSNMSWLIPLAVDKLKDQTLKSAAIRYRYKL